MAWCIFLSCKWASSCAFLWWGYKISLMFVKFYVEEINMPYTSLGILLSFLEARNLIFPSKSHDKDWVGFICFWRLIDFFFAFQPAWKHDWVCMGLPFLMDRNNLCLIFSMSPGFQLRINELVDFLHNVYLSIMGANICGESIRGLQAGV